MEGVESPPLSSGSFFTPLLLSMAGIVSTAFAILVYHYIVVKYCLRSRRQEIATRLSQQTPGGQLAIGVEENILETIPILAYSSKKGEVFRVDQSECVVCLGELEDGDVVRLLPNCRHAFHITCIDKWFLGHTTCPVCRSPIVAAVSIGNYEEGDGIDLTPQFHDQGSVPNSPMQSSGLLRHCVSLALPMEEKPRHLVTGLKRSLSMDQTYNYALLNIQRESESASSSSSSKVSITRSGSYRTRSMRQLDRVSSMLQRSFSRLRMGRQSSTTNGILPY